MIHVLLNIFAPALFFLIYYFSKKLGIIKKRVLSIIAFVIFVITVSIFLTFETIYIGNDISRYEMGYQKLSSISFGSIIQSYGVNKFFFYFFAKFFVLVKVPFRLFLFLLYVFSFFSIAFFIKKTAKNDAFAILLFFLMPSYQMYFTGIRQFVSMSFFILGCSFLFDKNITQKKQFLLFYVFFFFATCFHLSTLVFILLPLLKYIRKSKLVGFLFFVVSIFVLVAGPQIYYSITNVIDIGLVSSETEIIPFSVVFFFGIVSSSMILIILSNRKSKDINEFKYLMKQLFDTGNLCTDDNINTYYIISNIAILSMCFAVANNEIVRFHFYLDFFICVFVSDSFIKFSKKKQIIFALVIGIACYSYYLVRFMPYVRGSL